MYIPLGKIKNICHEMMGQRFRKREFAYRWLYDVFRIEHISTITAQEGKAIIVELRKMRKHHKWEGYRRS